MNLNEIPWGGSGIERCLYNFIVEKFPKGTKMLELGAGVISTQVFSHHFELTTIEQISEWCWKYPSNYIHAPLLGEWYDPQYLQNLPKDYEVVLVDGPSGDKRHGLLNHLELFNTDALWIFHDIYRPTERNLAINFANMTNKKIEFYEGCDYWASVK